MQSEVVILGTRGSVPVSGEQFVRYGGSTTCVYLRLAGQPIVLDAGTGLLDLPKLLPRQEPQIPVLLSHPHVDHLLGLPMCSLVFDPAKQIYIYAVTRNGKNAKQQVSSLVSPPLWPVGPDLLPAKIEFFELPEKMTLGSVTVETMEGIHPGGVTLFRLTGGGTCVVFVTDCTLTEGILPQVTEFARGCDLLLCDGQYSPAEWAGREHFGHNTWVSAAKLGADCGAAMVRILHHDPARTDAELDRAAEELRNIHGNCAFARAGEHLVL